MQSRRFIQMLGGASLALFLKTNASAQGLNPGETVLIWCLGRGPGRNRYLDGNTVTASVKLVPQRNTPLSGMWWNVVRVSDGVVALQCLGHVQGSRWLDGNTGTSQVGLAPVPRRPYTGTKWQVVPIDSSDRSVFALKCLGHIESPKRWLNGNTESGAVTLVEYTNPPFAGTRWRASKLVD